MNGESGRHSELCPNAASGFRIAVHLDLYDESKPPFVTRWPEVSGSPLRSGPSSWGPEPGGERHIPPPERLFDGEDVDAENRGGGVHGGRRPVRSPGQALAAARLPPGLRNAWRPLGG